MHTTGFFHRGESQGPPFAGEHSTRMDAQAAALLLRHLPEQCSLLLGPPHPSLCKQLDDIDTIWGTKQIALQT